MSAAEAPQFKAKGNEFFKARDYASAIEWYTKAVDADPENRVYYSNRSAAYSAARQYDLAAEDGRSCIRCDPDWNKGYFRLATALKSMGNYMEAHKAVTRGLVRPAVSNDPALLKLQAELEPHAKQAEAKERQGLPENERLKAQGNDLFKSQEFEKAIAKYQQALQHPLTESGNNKIYISCWNNISECRKQLHDHAGTVEAASMVLEYDQHNIKALLRRGLAFESLEKFQIGLEDIRAVLYRHPNDKKANAAQHRMSRALRQKRAMRK